MGLPAEHEVHQIQMNKTDKKSKKVPRTAALHDLSCFGRCALTVIDPVLSAMGVQCVPIPTALLSTHTGGFSGMYFQELDDALCGISDHFMRIGLKFDAVYTGFLGSARQAALIGQFIERFGADDGSGGTPLVLVDPVMGDDGELYHTCTPELIAAMRRLCVSADVITPNVTEACLLSGMTYREALELSDSDPERLGRLLADDLLGMSRGSRLRRVVITGIRCDGGKKLATVSCDASSGGNGELSVFLQPRIERDYPGTGDIFASVLLGSLLEGLALGEAAVSASRFAADCVRNTIDCGADEPVRNGVILESLLGRLADRPRRVAGDKL